MKILTTFNHQNERLALTEIFKRKRNISYRVYKLIADRTVGINFIVKQATIENHKNALERAIEWVARAFAFNELSIFKGQNEKKSDRHELCNIKVQILLMLNVAKKLWGILSQMTLLRWFTFSLRYLNATLTVLLFQIYFI